MRAAKQKQKTSGRAQQPKVTELCSSFFGRAPLRLHSCRALSCASTNTTKAHSFENATDNLTFHIPGNCGISTIDSRCDTWCPKGLRVRKTQPLINTHPRMNRWSALKWIAATGHDRREIAVPETRFVKAQCPADAAW